MNFKIIPVIGLLALAGCTKEQRAEVETIIGNLTGTTTTQQTGSLAIAAKVAAQSSSEPPADTIAIADPIPEPVVEPPAPVKECEEGEALFRVWDCVDGVKVYW